MTEVITDTGSVLSAMSHADKLKYMQNVTPGPNNTVTVKLRSHSDQVTSELREVFTKAGLNNEQIILQS